MERTAVSTGGKWFGNRHFYRGVLAVMIPILIQNGVTNFVNLLDNIMVGQLSTESMSGVSIVNQFVLVFYLAVFGGMAGPGIYTAQFHGSRNEDGVRRSFVLKLYIAVAACGLGILAFSLFGPNFIRLFLHEGSQEGDLELTLAEGMRYLRVSLFGFLPYALSNAIASTLRETGHPVLPMVSGIAAVVTNFALNGVLIFGLLGVPAMGVEGAAIATVVSRFVELAVLLIWSLAHKAVCPFIRLNLPALRIGGALAGQMLLKSVPLILNEVLWSLAMTMRNQCLSTRGLDVVAAQNIESTLVNLFNVIFLSVGSSVAILVGNQLGAGKVEQAKDTARKLIVFSILCAAGAAALLALSAPLFPRIYQTSGAVRGLATYMLFVQAVFLPVDAVANSTYFTLRSGGKVFWTIVADSGFMWAIVMPVCLILAYGTNLDIHWLFPLCMGLSVFKAGLGLLLLRLVPWARTLVRTGPEGEESEKKE